MNIKYLNKCNKRGEGEQLTTIICNQCNKEFSIRLTMIFLCYNTFIFCRYVIYKVK